MHSISRKLIRARKEEEEKETVVICGQLKYNIDDFYGDIALRP